MTNNMMCRRFELNEWALLREIRLEALKTEPGSYSSNYNNEKDLPENFWRDTAQSDNCRVFGLFSDAKPVGCIGIATMKSDAIGESAILWGTYIQKEWRGQKLSGLLYKTLIDYALSRKGWKRIVVSHRESNEASKRATLAHGFKYTHTEQKTWPDGVKEADLVYVLDLVPMREKGVSV